MLPLLQLLLPLMLLLLLSLVGSCRALSGDDVPATAHIAKQIVNGTQGHTAVLPCEMPQGMTADKTFNVIWMKGKVTLTLKMKHLLNERLTIVPTDIHTDNRFDLRIASLEPGDSAEYRCIGRRKGHPYNVKRIQLQVFIPPTINESKSSGSHKTLVEHERHTLTCVAHGEPPPTVKWFKEVKREYAVEGSSDRVPLGEGVDYNIDNVTRECGGIFVCVADNGIAPPASKRFTLTVKYKPLVVLKNEEISQKLGRSTMVMCIIYGNPLPTFYWERNGIRHAAKTRQSCEPPSPTQKYCLYITTSSRNSHVVQLDLMINNLTAEDFGVYYCVAKSDMGETRKATSVIEKRSSPPFNSRLPAPRLYEYPATETVDQPTPQRNTRPPTRDESEQRSPPAVEEAVSGLAPGSLTSKSFDPNSATSSGRASALAAAAAVAASLATLA